MDKISSIQLQKNIKDNSEAMQSFLKDLNEWEKDIKDVDKKLTGQQKDISSYNQDPIPPVRCKTSTNLSSANDYKRKKKGGGGGAVKEKERITAYDYAAWDKFDVEKALESSSGEEEEEEKETSVKLPKKENIREVKSSNKEKALALKDEGNKCYSKGRMDEAVAKYTRGIALDPTNAILPANRAMAYIKLQKFSAAEADCNRCLKLDPAYIKAYLRRGTSRLNMEKKHLAESDFRKVLELEPWNKDAKKELEKLGVVEATQTDSSISKSEDSQSATCKSTASNKHSQSTVHNHRKQKQQDTTTNVMQEKVADIKESTTKKVKDPQTSSGKEERGKKIKIIEVDSGQNGSPPEEAGRVLPIEKPVHLRSMKPLKKVPVTDVSSPDALLTLRKSKEQDQGSSSSKDQETSALQIKSSPKPEIIPLKTASVTCTTVPPIPKTSHQFTQEWFRLKSRPDLRTQYLKAIEPSFLSSVELEADALVDVISALKSEDITPSQAATYLIALSTSPGFSVNTMFLDDEQKKAILDVTAKCKTDDSYAQEIQGIEANVS